MKLKYTSPSIIPFKGIELETEYDVIFKGDKATLSLGSFKLEITKYQAESMFTEVKNKI